MNPAPIDEVVDLLRTLEWIHRHENLVVCGPSGTAKTHFCEALGHAAVDAGHKVSWFRLEHLGALVRRHSADDTAAKAIRRIMRALSKAVVDVIWAVVEPLVAGPPDTHPLGCHRPRVCDRQKPC